MQHWNDYWKEGFLTSFGSSFTGNYQGVYSQHWELILSRLSPNSLVLDVATGNGSIPLLGRKISFDKDLNLHFTGTDLAEVDKALIAKQIGVDKDTFPSDFTILTGIDSAKLPFAENHFDCVTSQYGFEYGDTRKTLEQISRVSKTGSTLALVIHHSDSVILIRNNQTLDCLNELIKNDGVLHLLHELVKAMGDIKNKYDLASLKGNKKSDRARNKLNECISNLEARFDIGFFDTNVAELITSLFKQYVFNTRAEKYHLIKNFRVSALSHIERLSDLKNAAFDENDINDLIELSQSLQLACTEKSELNDKEKGLLGWALTFENKK